MKIESMSDVANVLRATTIVQRNGMLSHEDFADIVYECSIVASACQPEQLKEDLDVGDILRAVYAEWGRRRQLYREQEDA